MDAKRKEIKGVLFDSGHVLNQSSTGHWFIPPKFFEYVDEKKYNSIDKGKINAAFNNATQHISCESLIESKEDEYIHFYKYYEIFSQSLPELELKEEEVKGLTTDLVYNRDKYVFFEDALKIIPELKSKYKLAVVSDAWPSLKDVYVNKGLYNYFDSFVISSILGVSKPNEKMYLTALDELKLLPQETVFIDDNLANCKGAMKLGIAGIFLCRHKLKYYAHKLFSLGKGYKVINNLEQLKDSNILYKI